MDSPPIIRRGPDELRRLLSEQTADVREMPVDRFRAWLRLRVEAWQRDPVFVQRCRVRDLRRAHPEIRAAENDERRARRVYERSPEHAELSRIEKALADAAKAIAGLSAAAAEAAEGAKHTELTAKRDAFATREHSLRREHDAAVRASDAHRALDAARQRLQGVRASTGLGALEDELRQPGLERGRRGGRQGARFEDVALAVTREHLLPELADACGCAPGELRILRGVTLGASGIELDQVIVRHPSNDGEAQVVALVEAKRGINDVAHGFRQRQRDLAWLTGDRASYAADAFRTRTFPTGHFDRAAIHHDGGESIRIGPASFRRFTRDGASGFFLDGLYLVTRPGWLWGAGPAALTRLSHRVATDERWAPDDDIYLAGLLRWLRGMTHPIESPDVLRLFAAHDVHARRIVLVEREPAPPVA
jgi:hypothetical protein